MYKNLKLKPYKIKLFLKTTLLALTVTHDDEEDFIKQAVSSLRWSLLHITAVSSHRGGATAQSCCHSVRPCNVHLNPCSTQTIHIRLDLRRGPMCQLWTRLPPLHCPGGR